MPAGKPTEYAMQQQAPSQQQPTIQPAASAGSASLAYSMDTDAMLEAAAGAGSQGSGGKGDQRPPSTGEMSAEQYYAGHDRYNQYQVEQQEQFPNQLEATGGEAGAGEADATLTVHRMHRKLLHLLSRPELFSDAMEWQSKVDRGLDPSKPDAGDGESNGIRSFDNEFEEQSRSTAAGEHKSVADATTATGGADAAEYGDQAKLLPPLPLQIFAPDAEVVLPQALTASQLFGIERVTGIELEAAAGVVALSRLFLRWLALMPEGDHANVVDPPGLTVMRISGGRYRVTGAHRVVWRWMNKFSPASAFAVPSSSGATGADGDGGEEEADTDFDFGDLVTMTIVDVFETDAEGRLLSYCPTFDNRAVHKTQEAVERIRKGASHLKERMEVVARSPAGQSVNKAADNLGKLTMNAAWAVGNIVKSKIEEEMQRHQQPDRCGGGTSTGASVDDAGGTEAGQEEEEEGTADGSKEGRGGKAKGEGYFSDESSAATPRRMEV